MHFIATQSCDLLSYTLPSVLKGQFAVSKIGSRELPTFEFVLLKDQCVRLVSTGLECL